MAIIEITKDNAEEYAAVYGEDMAENMRRRFYVEDKDVIASILATEDEDGVLEFQWMDADNLEELDRLRMIFFVIVNALDLYPDYSEVVICPYLSEVEEVLERFGFTEDSSGHVTRIYNYYI